MRSDDLRAVEWAGAAIRLIDQRLLPVRLAYLNIDDVDALVEAVRGLAVRGAPALGAVGALGVVVAMRQGRRQGWSADRLAVEIDKVRRARPTAVNLAWGVDRVLPLVAGGTPAGQDAVLSAALELIAEDEAGNHEIGRLGADWILARVSRRPVRVLTHCNAGFLATCGWGTALGVVRELHARGALEVVYADETRPLLQGSRLTAWELAADAIPHFVQADAAAASTIVGGLVDVAIIGADRVAANGDIANKVGSLGVALACQDAGIPFVVAAPESTLDPATATGADIQVELRDGEEVLCVGGVRVAPEGSRGFNPAFDVTPARLVTALVTQARVLEVSAGQLP